MVDVVVPTRTEPASYRPTQSSDLLLRAIKRTEPPRSKTVSKSFLQPCMNVAALRA
jgi:hypothetical protein